MIKTVMAIFMMMAFAASAQAESALLTLPYGIELGKPLTDAQKQRNTTQESLKNGKIRYDFTGRFTVLVDRYKVAQSLDFGAPDKLPRGWRRLGLQICDERSTSGTPYDETLAIFKKEGAKNIRVVHKYDIFKTVKLDLDGKFTYELNFMIEKDAHGHCGGMGLWSVTVSRYDDY